MSSPTPAMPPTPTVTVRAVLENNERSIVEALTMVRSLRAFGGSIADAPCELHFVEALPTNTQPFIDLGAELRIVGRVDARCPHANKLGMFYPVDTDYLLAVDADLVFCGDVSPYLIGSAVAAAPSNGDWMPEGGWEELYDHAGVRFPSDRIMTFRFWQETIPYFNSGVIVVPAEHCQTLHDKWHVRLIEMLDAADSRPWWGEQQRYFADQISFAIAMSSGLFPRRQLPIEMNFLMEYGDLPEHLHLNDVRPLLLHTIHKMNLQTGEILDAPYRECQAAVERYNALLGSVSERAAASV